ncbi:MAG TPA: glutamate ABC transporter substrate-binding protein, partial [Acidimicrobiales bacterium]|nr:glutamate ABC transporter substrate-binding protein [Acidimicrobiales bacterium]
SDPTRSLRPQSPLPPPGQMPPGSFMRHVQDTGRLIVGVDQNTLLFGSRNPVTGQIEGFDIDMLHQVAKAIFPDVDQNPNRIEYKAITSAQRIPDVTNGSVDIVAETMTINCQRWQQVDFSTDYYDAGQRVLVRTDSKAKSIDDFGGKKVCAAAGSTSIANIASRPSHPVPYTVADWTDCLVALQQGTVDAISTDDTILYGLAAQDPYTKVIGDPPFTHEPYGMAINQGHPEFVRFVNGILDRMRADGTWTATWNKWLQPVLKASAPAPPTATYRD